MEGYSERTKRRRIRARVLQHFESSNILNSNSEIPCPQSRTPSCNTDMPDAALAANSEDEYETNLSPISSDSEQNDADLNITNYIDSDIEESDITEHSSNEHESEDDAHDLRGELAAWATTSNLSHSSLASLLPILINAKLDLPKDPRTLLKTPRLTDIKELAGGSYYHFGLQNAIVAHLVRYSPDLTGVNALTLQVNVDGLPLFRSSNVSLWPILGRIQEIPESEPFVIGVYCGATKPTSLKEFLNDFVQDAKSVTKEGITFNDQHFGVDLGAFICDAPARAFLKCVKGHSGYSACERCTQEGEYIDGRMTFPELDAPSRTDRNFDEMMDEGHHTGESPLKELSIGFVTQFVLDYMHLVCLGVVRKMIYLWIKGPLTIRLPAVGISAIPLRK